MVKIMSIPLVSPASVSCKPREMAKATAANAAMRLAVLTPAMPSTTIATRIYNTARVNDTTNDAAALSSLRCLIATLRTSATRRDAMISPTTKAASALTMDNPAPKKKPEKKLATD